MVCHQLRNTFQVLLGHVTMGEIADDAERARRLTMIEETLEQSRPLLDQLMSMAHPDEGRTETCDVGTLVRQFEVQARLVLPSNIRFEAEVDPELPRVVLNSRGLVHVLWNLVINARQAIRGEGRIAVRCGVSEGEVLVEVADTGCGMPDDVRRRVFDPYFTTKPPGQGTGLGLTAVDRFVRSSNGAVEVESQPGAGATFRMRFPAQPTAASRSA
jgi:signal transduction histidine kinase